MEPRRYCTEERWMRLCQPPDLACSGNGHCGCSMAAAAVVAAVARDGDYRGPSTEAVADL